MRVEKGRGRGGGEKRTRLERLRQPDGLRGVQVLVHVVDQLDLVPELPPHVRHQPRDLLHVVVGPKLSSRAERAVRLPRRLAGALEEVGAGVHLVAVGQRGAAWGTRRALALAAEVPEPHRAKVLDALRHLPERVPARVHVGWRRLARRPAEHGVG